MTAALPPITWLELTTADAGRWAWSRQLRWPFPVASAGVARWQPSLDELLGEVAAPPVRRSRGEERLLDAIAEVLTAPQYCAYVMRADAVAAAESSYAALVRDDEAVVLVDEPGTVRLARVHPTTISAVLAAQLPPLRAAPVTRVQLPAQTAALLASGFARGSTPERTLRSALATAGVPDRIAERFFADPAATTATATVGAVGYDAENLRPTTRSASWTEMPDGGMICSQGKAGDLVWEPLTVAAIHRALVDALSGLGS